MLVTVLTPTYNRASLLPRLYESLCRQTCKDFEWIVVDDGSVDGTEETIRTLSQESGSDFVIRYIKKSNGGKHTAVNLGVRKAKGELTLILDSDDELPPTAIEDIKEEWGRTKEYQTVGKPVGGVCGYMSHKDGKVIGRPLVEAVCDELSLRYDKKVKGDMCEVFRTDILRRFPFPEIKGERFCPECLVWNRIAQEYSLYVFPKVIYLRDYLAGGLTDNIVRIRMKSPVASMMTYAEMLGYEIPFMSKIKAAINYWRFRHCLKPENKDIRTPGVSLSWLIFAPIGWLMHLRDFFLYK